MRILAGFLLLCAALFSSNLSTYNVYERSERVDIMLGFDAPYSGKILQGSENGAVTLTFEGLSFDQEVEKSINSAIAQEISITPRGDNLVLGIKSDTNVLVSASKTPDGFGLRVRITPQPAPQNQSNLTPKSSTNTLNLPNLNFGSEQNVTFKNDDVSDLIDARYYMVLGVLGLLLLVLLVIKNKLKNKGQSFKSRRKDGWFERVKSDDQVKIIYEKPLDNANKVVFFRHLDREYLVLVGNSNVLLDKFIKGHIGDEKDFELLLEENSAKLQDHIDDRQQLDTYKDKASID